MNRLKSSLLEKKPNLKKNIFFSQIKIYNLAGSHHRANSINSHGRTCANCLYFDWYNDTIIFLLQPSACTSKQYQAAAIRNNKMWYVNWRCDIIEILNVVFRRLECNLDIRYPITCSRSSSSINAIVQTLFVFVQRKIFTKRTKTHLNEYLYISCSSWYFVMTRKLLWNISRTPYILLN